MKIEFNSPQKKGQSRFVRFDEDVDAELVQIAQAEGVDLAEIIRTFTDVGLDMYRLQKESETNKEDK